MRIVVSGSLATIIAPMQGLSANARRAMRQGLQDGGDKVRTRVRRALKVQANPRLYSTIVANVKSGMGAGLTYEIRGLHKGLPIQAFPGGPFNFDPSRPGYMRWSPRLHWKLQPREHGRFGKLPALDMAGEVRAAPWGHQYTFKRSYVSAKGVPMAAIPGGRHGWSFRPLWGASISKEIVMGEALVSFHAGVASDVIPAVEARLARLV